MENTTTLPLYILDNFSYFRLAGASRKFPKDWEKKWHDITDTVRDTQLEKWVNQILIPGITDKRWVNTDHVPFNMKCIGDYTWGEKNSGRRQVGTAGYEKQHFTAQFTVTKDGEKFPVFFIFKVALPTSDRAPSKNTVAFELKQHKPDSYGNHYLTEEKAVLRCAPKATSNQDLTKDILKNSNFPLSWH